MDVRKLAPNSMFSCSLCGIKCASISAVKRHIKYKHGEITIHECPLPGCSYKTGRPDTLNRHFLTVHRVQDFNHNLIKELEKAEVDITAKIDTGENIIQQAALQSVISPYIQGNCDNVLDMDIPKLIESQQVLSNETPNAPLYEHTTQLAQLLEQNTQDTGIPPINIQYEMQIDQSRGHW